MTDREIISSRASMNPLRPCHHRERDCSLVDGNVTARSEGEAGVVKFYFSTTLCSFHGSTHQRRQ